MKKFLIGLGTVLVLALVWYLFLKPSDYIIRFKASTFPGAINQTLKLWDTSLDTVQGIQQEGEDLTELKQTLRFSDSTHVYHWKINPITDSTAQVVVGVQDTEHSLMNKILVPFSDTDFEKRSRKTVREFMENLKQHEENFRVNIIGEVDFQSKYIAYIPLKVAQFQKAGGMMKNVSYLSGELFTNGVQLDGLPMVEITHWDRVNDSIYYNLAQPIVRVENLPQDTEIKYKRIFGKRALKAEYFGNYITSDRAWYALMDYAQRENIAVEPIPIEVFHNNPNSGGDAMRWKADIYLPLKENND
ncbi:MAG: AraC family transcriptional regulator [Bacteroidota bacterium]